MNLNRMVERIKKEIPQTNYDWIGVNIIYEVGFNTIFHISTMENIFVISVNSQDEKPTLLSQTQAL